MSAAQWQAGSDRDGDGPAPDHGQGRGQDHGQARGQDDGEGDGHDDGHGHDDDGLHLTRRGYVTGFVLAVVLTAIPFWLVMGGVITNGPLLATVLLALGAVQIVVHMIYFLHLNARVEQGWSLLALLFTFVLLIIALAGSLWIMQHLDANMMPMPAGAARQLP